MQYPGPNAMLLDLPYDAEEHWRVLTAMARRHGFRLKRRPIPSAAIPTYTIEFDAVEPNTWNGRKYRNVHFCGNRVPDGLREVEWHLIAAENRAHPQPDRSLQ